MTDGQTVKVAPEPIAEPTLPDQDSDAQREPLEQAYKDAAQKYSFRKWQVWAVWGAISIWLIIVVVVLAFQGWGIINFPNSVLIALIASWPAAIAGYLVQIARYIFPVTSKPRYKIIGPKESIREPSSPD